MNIQELIAWIREPSTVGAFGTLLGILGYNMAFIDQATAFIVVSAGLLGQLLLREKSK